MAKRKMARGFSKKLEKTPSFASTPAHLESHLKAICSAFKYEQKIEVLSLINSDNNLSLIEKIMCRICYCVSFYHDPTLGQLHKSVEDFKGEYETQLKENLILWSGMSQEAIQALHALKQQGWIELKLTDVGTFLWEGSRILDMPIATKQGINQGYKTPHWIPAKVIPGSKFNEIEQSRNKNF